MMRLPAHRILRRMLPALSLLAASIALAQSGSGYVIRKHIVAGGGKAATGSGGYEARGTVGQPGVLPANAAASSYLLHSGFWTDGDRIFTDPFED